MRARRATSGSTWPSCAGSSRRSPRVRSTSSTSPASATASSRERPAGRGAPYAREVNADLPTVASIHVAKARRLEMRAVESVVAEEGKGLVGDRYHGTKHRHVTVQSAEGLAEASRLLGREVPPAGTRRNLTLSRGTVPTTPGSTLRIRTV